MEIGARVGPYRVLEKIGDGGMGSVWLAEHAMIGRRAAIKVLHPELSNLPELVKRFFNEARAATTAADPGIVQIFDFGQHPDVGAYIVMELLEGEPLGRRLARSGVLEVPAALRIMRQVASTLGAAHARGIVHRDLKPANVFIVRDPEVAGGERGASSGAANVFTRTAATWSQHAYVKASDSRANIHFGLSVAVSGDGSTLAVGTEDTGTVYVFARAGTTWIQKAIVGASSTEPGDRFGSSLALSADGSRLAVGAPFEASAATGVNGNQADNSAPQSGAVYVFTRAGAMWTQRAYVKASNTGAGDQFGWRLALSADGSRLAVGAPFEASAATGVDGDQADNSAPRSGAVHVFESVGTALVQRHYVKASNTSSHDQLGSSLALSGDGSMLVVGAFGEASAATGVDGDQADDLAMASGAVYMFQ